MKRQLNRSGIASRRRSGVFMVLAALLMVVIFSFVALAVDVGYMNVVKAELQNAADAAAMAGCQEIGAGSTAIRSVAKDVAFENFAGGDAIMVPDSDVEIGIFNYMDKTFTVNETSPNAVRVTTRVNNEGLLFAPLLGRDTFNTAASSIAMLNPRDIVFVVDCSGSMNDDTEPCWAPAAIESTFAPQGYSGIGGSLMQAVYDDLGFGAYPGPSEWIGQPLGVPQDNTALACMTQDDGPLAALPSGSTYRIKASDSETNRKQKAYKWIMDMQIKVLMPNVSPYPDINSNYSYWEKYIDYVLEGAGVGSPVPAAGGGGTGSGVTPGTPTPPLGWLDPEKSLFDPSPLPRHVGQVAGGDPFLVLELLGCASAGDWQPGVPRRDSNSYIFVPTTQDSDRLTGFNNPNIYSFPGFSTSYPSSNFRNRIGYVTYVQFLMDWGRDRSPEGSTSTNADLALAGKTPLSIYSPSCPRHVESIAGRSYNFPPREQPMHAVRRSLIKAMDVVKVRNLNGAGSAGDRVAIITFDGLDAYHSPQLIQPLSTDYDSAMDACINLQAVSDIGSTTATEAGLILARNHLKLPAEGGQGRNYSKKVIVLLTDGIPNAWSSSNSEISSYISANPAAEYYASDYVWLNAALVQSATGVSEKVTMYPVGMGLGTDYDFMDRMARLAITAAGGQSIRGSGNPLDYEDRLTQIFTDIIKNPGSRLVK